MTDEGSRPSYFDALIRKRIRVRIGREPLWLSAPSTYQYTLYEYLSYKLLDVVQDEASSLTDRVSIVTDLLRVVVGDDKLEMLRASEVPEVMLAAKELYVDPPLLAWQMPPDKKPDEKGRTGVTVETNLDYPGRNLAYLVALLSHAFGWSSRHILHEISIYEAYIYAQESMLQAYEEREWAYALSEVGFKKVGDGYEKQRLAPLPWVQSTMKKDRAKMTPIPEKFLPGGGEIAIQGLRYDPATGRVIPYAIENTAVPAPT